MNEDGTINYDWKIIGGSGKWDGATGLGKIVQTLDQDHKTYSNAISGEIVLK